MAWVGGLFVLLTMNVNIGVRMAVEPTASTTATMTMKATASSSMTSASVLASDSMSMSMSLSTTPSYQSSTKQLFHQSAKPTSAAVTVSSILTQKTFFKNANAPKAKHTMSESVVILSPNSEKEAQEIYDKALKQFDSYGVSTRQTCAEWEKHGCQCSGTVEQLILSCRSIGLNETPTELPKSLIKL